MTSISPVQMDFDFNEDQFVNLTSMYAKAVEAGKAKGKVEPKYWKRNEGKTFVAKLGHALKVTEHHLWTATRGKKGGTWAHWQIAAAYATYLDEDLHMQFNAAVRALHLGDPAIVDVLLRNASEDDKRRMLSKLTRRIFTDRIQAAGVDDPIVYGRLTNIVTQGVLGAKADVAKIQRGLKAADSLRDNLTHTELVRLTLAESMAADAIEGGADLVQSCERAAAIVARTKQ